MESNIESTTVVAKPKEVRVGVFLFYASLIIGGIRSVVDLKTKVRGPAVLVGVLFLIVLLGVLFFLVLKASRGRNWARIVLAILVAVGIVLGSSGYIQEYRTNAQLGAISIGIALLQLIGTIMLFMPNANAWFRKRK
jgi:quinol-cytochrome oxidoreductase complex cytochrome b subunit